MKFSQQVSFEHHSTWSYKGLKVPKIIRARNKRNKLNNI